MRLHVISDLHQEFGEQDVPDVECDCVVLAGDIATKQNGLRWIQKRFRNVPVIYVCGNHEFYGDKYPRLIERLRLECAGSNVHFLEDESVTLSGVRIFGCTLWTDMALQGDCREGAAEADSQMNDFKRVRNSDNGYKRFRALNARSAHLHSLDAMTAFFSDGLEEPSVVVTHHAPSIRSLPERRRSELISCAYASHLDEFILRHQPRLWIHGHIHHSNDYRIGTTRVVANPRAYPDQPNPTFVPDLVIEV